MTNSPPIALSELRSLFEYLDGISMDGYKCDHTYAQTIQFMSNRGLAAQPMLEWLSQNGAGCDCEIMFNVAQQWEEAVGYVPPDN